MKLNQMMITQAYRNLEKLGFIEPARQADGTLRYSEGPRFTYWYHDRLDPLIPKNPDVPPIAVLVALFARALNLNKTETAVIEMVTDNFLKQMFRQSVEVVKDEKGKVKDLCVRVV